jgi:hypothetical protein
MERKQTITLKDMQRNLWKYNSVDFSFRFSKNTKEKQIKNCFNFRLREESEVSKRYKVIEEEK